MVVMMAREEESEAWGTWEELLLGFAVKRHGLADWDSVAAEVRTKSSLPRLFLTAHHCKVKFDDLKRRFASQNADVLERHEDETIPWLDELRKLRVAELKREVRNYDVSILSLETKVKRLEEERELNVRGNGIFQGKPDLEELRERSENDKGDEPERTGGELDRSVNESNTTGSKGKSGGEEVRLGLEALRTGSSGPESEPMAENSHDGSSDTVAKSQSETELRRDSAARESSEVQSSASLSRKRKRRGRRRMEASGGLDPAETMEVTGKSQPFVRVLEMIRAQSGSLFERRLESQENEEYKNLVKQHVDLEAVQSRLVKGNYSSCTLAFYRDLLLLFNNAALFFPKSSLESITAHQLRHLLLNEIPKRNNSFPKEPSPTPNAAASLLQPKPELERSHSLLAKHNSPAPIVVCRKRSSISAKPNSSAITIGQKDKQASDEKMPVDPNSPPIKPSSDNSMLKTNAKDKPVTGVRSSRRSNKNPTNNNTSSASSKKQTSMSPGLKPGLGNKLETLKSDQKNKTEASTLGKKRSAADFLKRIKWNSPGETVKSSSSKEQKSRHNGKGGDKKERRALRQSSERKLVRGEESSPSKRSVGRPPRKAAEANAVSVKRGKGGSGGKGSGGLEAAKKAS